MYNEAFKNEMSVMKDGGEGVGGAGTDWNERNEHIHNCESLRYLQLKYQLWTFINDLSSHYWIHFQNANVFTKSSPPLSSPPSYPNFLFLYPLSHTRTLIYYILKIFNWHLMINVLNWHFKIMFLYETLAFIN